MKHHQNTGLTAPQKFILQLAAAVAFLVYRRNAPRGEGAHAPKKSENAT